MEIGTTLTVRRRLEWRRWLARHHADTREIWLVYYKKASGKAGISYEESVLEGLAYGWIDGQTNRSTTTATRPASRHAYQTATGRTRTSRASRRSWPRGEWRRPVSPRSPTGYARRFAGGPNDPACDRAPTGCALPDAPARPGHDTRRVPRSLGQDHHAAALRGDPRPPDPRLQHRYAPRENARSRDRRPGRRRAHSAGRPWPGGSGARAPAARDRGIHRPRA